MLFSPKSQLKIFCIVPDLKKKNAFKKKEFEMCDGEKTVTNFIESPTWGAICQEYKMPPFSLSKSADGEQSCRQLAKDRSFS